MLSRSAGSWHVWEHRIGIGRQISYVSRIYESFSVHISLLVFSSIGKLLWLLKLEQKRELPGSCHFSLLAGGVHFWGRAAFFLTPVGILPLFKKINKSILVILCVCGESVLRKQGKMMLSSVLSVKLGLDRLFVVEFNAQAVCCFGKAQISARPTCYPSVPRQVGFIRVPSAS